MLAIVAAFRQEIGAFLKAGRFRQSGRDGRLRFFTSNTMPGIAVAVGGFGREGAIDSVRRTIAEFSPNMIICAGFSGGAADGLETGDVVVGNRTVAVEGSPDAWTPDGARWIETEQSALDEILNALADSGATYAVAPCLTAPAFVSDPAIKRRLGKTFGISAIDMESYWAMTEAARRGVPCVPVRVILDPVEQRVSRLVADTLWDSPARRAFRSAAHLAAHPGEARGLLRLSGQVRRARAALGGALAGAAESGGWM